MLWSCRDFKQAVASPMEPQSAANAMSRKAQVSGPTVARDLRSSETLPDNEPKVIVANTPLTVRMSCAFDSAILYQSMARSYMRRAYSTFGGGDAFGDRQCVQVFIWHTVSGS